MRFEVTVRRDVLDALALRVFRLVVTACTVHAPERNLQYCRYGRERVKRRNLAAAVVFLALMLGSTAAASQGSHPEDLGLLRLQVATVQIAVPVSVLPHDPEGVFTSLIADLYVPQATGPFPLVEISHDWPGTRRSLGGWGRLLASHGYLVIVPDRRGSSAIDTAPPPIASIGAAGLDVPADIVDLGENVNSDDMLRVVRWAEAQNRDATSALYGKVDSKHVALAGHSIGGYYATFAAAKAQSAGPRITTLLLLDPTDERLGNYSLDSSLAVAPSLQLPTEVLASEEKTHPIQCNMSFGPDCTIVSEQEYAALTHTSALYGLRVVRAIHTDVEDYGSKSRTEPQRMFERYGISWLNYWLKNDCTALGYLNGSDALTDQQAGRIALFQGSRLPASC